MGTQGVFGYTIGRKKRIIHVQYDADLLWQILVREIYVLIKHYGSKEALQTAFEGIKTTKNNPKKEELLKWIEESLIKDGKQIKKENLINVNKIGFKTI